MKRAVKTFRFEVWKIVPSLPTIEVSSLGRVRVIPYKAPLPRGGMRTYSGKATYGYWSEDRFVFISRRRTYKLARLICEAFNGPAPADKPNCLHKDEDSRNNKPDNLFWGTQKENLNHPKFLAYCRSRTGPNNPYVKGIVARGQS